MFKLGFMVAPFLLREAERRTGFLRYAPQRLPDQRDARRIDHSLTVMLRQRVFSVALGYCELNDYKPLRDDSAFQAAVSRTGR